MLQRLGGRPHEDPPLGTRMRHPQPLRRQGPGATPRAPTAATSARFSSVEALPDGRGFPPHLRPPRPVAVRSMRPPRREGRWAEDPPRGWSRQVDRALGREKKRRLTCRSDVQQQSRLGLSRPEMPMFGPDVPERESPGRTCQKAGSWARRIGNPLSSACHPPRFRFPLPTSHFPPWPYSSAARRFSR
jgi:hypothetical protein